MSFVENLKASFGFKPKRKASATTRTLYEADQRDRFLLAAGQKFTPQNLLTYITRADAGDTRFLYAFYDEMISRDPHLANEYGKAAGAIAGARIQVLAYPAKYRASKLKNATGEDALPSKIAGFIEEQLKRPDLNLRDGIKAWFNGEAKGLGACEVRYSPMSAELPDGGMGTGLDKFVPIPSQRFRFDPSGVELWLQPTGDPSVVVKASDFQPGQIAVYIANADRPNPSRRGLLRLVMAAWIARTYGPGWWQRFVELYGSPLRVGKANSNDPETLQQLQSALAEMANTGSIILPMGATIEFVEAAARAMSSPPHATLMEFNGDEMTKVFRGATQTTKIATNAGSQASATVHKDVSEEVDAERAFAIASVLRNQVAYWLVAKNWGEDIAKKFTPEIILDVHGQPDFTVFAQGLGFWKAAGMGPTTPLQWAHDTVGVPMADDDDETMAGPVDPAIPAMGPDGKPVENDPVKIAKATKPAINAKPMSKSGPGQTPTMKPKAKLDDDAYDVFADAMTGPEVVRSAVPKFEVPAHAPGGLDIVAPVRIVIDKAVKEGQPLHVVKARLKHRLGRPTRETGAILAAAIAEATFRGIESARREQG